MLLKEHDIKKNNPNNNNNNSAIVTPQKMGRSDSVLNNISQNVDDPRLKVEALLNGLADTIHDFNSEKYHPINDVLINGRYINDNENQNFIINSSDETAIEKFKKNLSTGEETAVEFAIRRLNAINNNKCIKLCILIMDYLDLIHDIAINDVENVINSFKQIFELINKNNNDNSSSNNNGLEQFINKIRSSIDSCWTNGGSANQDEIRKLRNSINAKIMEIVGLPKEDFEPCTLTREQSYVLILNMLSDQSDTSFIYYESGRAITIKKALSYLIKISLLIL
jgi:hypothetical protein